MNKIIGLFTNSVFLIIALVISLGLGAFSYNLYQSSQYELAKVKSNPQSLLDGEAKQIIAKIGALVSLPEGENPTIATIADKSKLKNQNFFAKAENGDKVLIYTQAKRAYLYSIRMNKVLEIAPVNIGNSQAQVAGSSTTAPAESEVPIPTPTQVPGPT